MLHIEFPESADPFAILERVRQELFPGVKLEPWKPEPVKPKEKRARRKG
jgi:hypothetical protein